MKNQKSPLFLGYLMVLSSAVMWGVSGVCAQYLFEEKGISPSWLVCWRMVIAGCILLGFAFFRKNSDATKIWQKKRDIFEILIFSTLGMLAVQCTYFFSINLSNAATATVLQFVGPVFVVGFYAIKFRRWPKVSEYVALILAMMGTFLLVTHGSFQELVISKGALFWGLLSAVSLAVYTIQPVQLLKRFSSPTVTGWGMFIGGVIFMLATDPWYLSGNWDLGTFLAFSYIIVLGTVVPFSLFLASLNIVGAQTASLLISVEPLSAALVAVAWLGITFTGMDWLGTLFIVITVSLLTLSKKTVKLPAIRAFWKGKND